MIRMNPHSVQDKPVTRSLFPPSENFFPNLFAGNYQDFLKTNAATDEGMQIVARHYEVEQDWNAYLNKSSHNNRARDYYTLLHIVKTSSEKDHLWISFIEGLHRHAVIIMCLTCSSFYFGNNNIIHESMQRRHFKKAQVPHYKRPLLSPIQVLNSILNGDFDASMLMKSFPVQILVLSKDKLNISTITTTLKAASMWISTNKKLSADKSISKWLAEELTKIMDFSKPTDRNKFRPDCRELFFYQSDLDKTKFEKACLKSSESGCTGYSTLIDCEEFKNYINNPFN